MYLLYSVALGLALALASPYWLLQALRHGKYRSGTGQRLGRPPRTLRATSRAENCIWVHAVSVGEVLAVSGVIQALQARFGGEGWRVVVSTTTMTGQRLARERFGEENVFYLPLDFAFAIRPYLRRLRPRMMVIAETEFWPNLLRLAREGGVRVAIVNARISDRSYPRYLQFKSLLKKVLLAVDVFLAQSEQDRERLVAIGAEAARVQVSGNLKYEIPAARETALVEKLRSMISAEAKVLVCGSTVEGEEALLLPALRRLLEKHPRAVVVLAPRHPERFSEVETLLSREGLAFVKRSLWEGEPVEGGVFLLDTIGELSAMYALGAAAFVGGSLVRRGGHNILEPARVGTPIFVGPHTENFREIVQEFRKADALYEMDPAKAEEELQTVFDARWKAMGERGRQVFIAQSGALQRTLDALETLMWMPSTMRAGYSKGQG